MSASASEPGLFMCDFDQYLNAYLLENKIFLYFKLLSEHLMEKKT